MRSLHAFYMKFQEVNMLKMFTLLCCIAAIAISGLLLFWMKRKTTIESTRVQYLNGYIICGVSRYLRSGIIYIAAAVAVFFLLLLLAAGQITAGMYLVGALIGMADGLLVSSAVIVGNTRIASAAVHGDAEKAEKMSYYTAVIAGTGAVGISVLGLLLTYWSMNFTLFTEGLPGLLLGVSTVAFLGRSGGELFAKMYDVVDSLIAGAAAAMLLAESAVTDAGVNATFSAGDAAVIAFALIASGVLVALLSVPVIRSRVHTYGHSMDQVLIVASVVTAAAALFLSWYRLDNLTYAGAVISGIAAGLVGELATRIYTDSTDHKMREMVREGGRRAAMLERLSQGMAASILPVICQALGIGMAYYFAGNYGIGLGAVGIVSVSAVQLTLQGLVMLTQTSSSVIDAVATEGEAEKVRQPLQAFKESLSRSRNGISSGAACMTAVALLISMAGSMNLGQVSLLNPMVVCGSLIGIMFPFAFTSRSMTISGSALHDMAADLKNRIGINGSSEIGKEQKAEIRNKVRHSAASTMKGLYLSGIITVLVPILIAIIVGSEMLAGLLIGAIVSGVLLGAIMFNAGSLFRNISDSSIYIVIKLMVIVSITLGPVLQTLK